MRSKVTYRYACLVHKQLHLWSWQLIGRGKAQMGAHHGGLGSPRGDPTPLDFAPLSCTVTAYSLHDLHPSQIPIYHFMLQLCMQAATSKWWKHSCGKHSHGVLWISSSVWQSQASALPPFCMFYIFSLGVFESGKREKCGGNHALHVRRISARSVGHVHVWVNSDGVVTSDGNVHGRASNSPRALLGKALQELLQLWPLLDAGELTHCQQVLQQLGVVFPCFFMT